MRVEIEQHVNMVKMPENLRVGMMVAEYRKKCEGTDCPFDYFALSFGQSPFHVPSPLQQALAENAHQGHYSDAQGIEELRQAISSFYQRFFDTQVDPEKIIIGPGTKELLHMIFSIVAGDVILPSPSWIGYYPELLLLNKQFHTLHLSREDDYKVNPEKLDAFVHRSNGNLRMLVLNTPHNPTGAVYTRTELEAIVAVCRRHKILIVADEIYALSTYDFTDFTSLANLYPEGSFVTNGLSKDRSAGGYRLGHLILPEAGDLRDAFKKVAATIQTNVSTPTQHAAIAAYSANDEIDEYFEITRSIHAMAGRFMAAELNAIEGLQATIPAGGFYCFLSFNELTDALRARAVKTSNDLAHSLLSHPHHIAVVTGDALMLQPDDFGARVAFVDYDGPAVYEAFRQEQPTDEHAFIQAHMPRLYESIDAFGAYVEWLKSH